MKLEGGRGRGLSFASESQCYWKDDGLKPVKKEEPESVPSSSRMPVKKEEPERAPSSRCTMPEKRKRAKTSPKPPTSEEKRMTEPEAKAKHQVRIIGASSAKEEPAEDH